MNNIENVFKFIKKHQPIMQATVIENTGLPYTSVRSAIKRMLFNKAIEKYTCPHCKVTQLLKTV